jgi:hypothetical protein
MIVPAVCVVAGALLAGVATPATIAIAGFSTGGVVAGTSMLSSAQTNANTICVDLQAQWLLEFRVELELSAPDLHSLFSNQQALRP